MLNSYKDITVGRGACLRQISSTWLPLNHVQYSKGSFRMQSFQTTNWFASLWEFLLSNFNPLPQLNECLYLHQYTLCHIVKTSEIVSFMCTYSGIYARIHSCATLGCGWFIIGQSEQPHCFHLLVTPSRGVSKEITFVGWHIKNFFYPFIYRLFNHHAFN